MGLGEGEGIGEGRAARGSRYRVRRWSGVAPRLGICSPPARPPRATCSSPGHRRVSLPARRPLRDPLGPLGPRKLLAGCNFRHAASSGEARPTRPGTRCQRGPSPGPAPSYTAQWPAAVGRVPGPCIVSCSEPQPPLKSAINFPSLLRPARPRASPRLLTRRAPLAAPELRPPASARRTLLPGPLSLLHAGAAAPTPAGRPNRKVPAPVELSSVDAMAAAAMAARGIPQGAGGKPTEPQKRTLGVCPSWAWGLAISQRTGMQP